MAVTLLFRCGCPPTRIDPDKVTAPRCRCGETRVARTVQAEAPRFRGCVCGPHAQTVALAPIAVAVAKTPLRLKDDEHA